MIQYDQAFYANRDRATRTSAETILGFLLEHVSVHSAIDVGCGVGTWLAVLRERGIEDVLGIEGDWLDRSLLVIPEANFVSADLRRPLPLQRTFDLAISLEVAEHLPPEAADAFVKTLTDLAPLVLFSAALPNQGGVGHLNEQWPDYWCIRFEAAGFCVVDAVRPVIWSSPQVLWWYAQNTLLFVREDLLGQNEWLRLEYEHSTTRPRTIIHPLNYQDKWTLYNEADKRARLLDKERRSVRHNLKDIWRNLGAYARRRSGS